MEALTRTIYEHYPRQEARPKAEVAIWKALKVLQKEEGLSLSEAHERLLRTTIAYRKHREYVGGAEAKFTPLPATWYNQGRYMDEAQWKIPPEEIKEKFPPEDWANANWKPILEAYRIDWGNVLYWGDSWNQTWANLPAPVRADLTYAWRNE